VCVCVYRYIHRERVAAAARSLLTLHRYLFFNFPDIGIILTVQFTWQWITRLRHRDETKKKNKPFLRARTYFRVISAGLHCAALRSSASILTIIILLLLCTHHNDIASALVCHIYYRGRKYEKNNKKKHSPRVLYKYRILYEIVF